MQTIEAADAVELARVVRSDFIESRHLGAAVALSPSGEVLASLGDINAPVFARSTLKPLQTIASMNAGAELQGAQIALASGSHTGSFEHMKIAQSILEEASLDAAALQCPPAWPVDEASYHALVQAGREKTRLAFNCSGKHSAFLWACQKNNWPIKNYRDCAHPLQQLVAETVEKHTGEKPAAVGIDGCGAPVFAVSLCGLARAYSALGGAIENIRADARLATVATAMVDYPEFVQGHGKPNTVLSEVLNGIVKGGAEGVLAIGLRSGASVAVKVLDGSSRATSLIALKLLEACELISVEIAQRGIEATTKPIMGAEEAVGSLEVGSALAQLIEASQEKK
ncbi:MAG: asparaginase [Rothia sp. (in: high G+C Gram-positive bacteria)]|nr:asparaginase [Rothia sp. (in: high G+C Gram-positive bacteria)]